jgi:hypothetical protein
VPEEGLATSREWWNNAEGLTLLGGMEGSKMVKGIFRSLSRKRSYLLNKMINDTPCEVSSDIEVT